VKSYKYCITLKDEFCYGKPLNTVVRIIINVIYIYIYIRKKNTIVFGFEKAGLLQLVLEHPVWI